MNTHTDKNRYSLKGERKGEENEITLGPRKKKLFFFFFLNDKSLAEMERSLKDNKPRLRTDGVTHNHRPIRTTKTVIVRRQDTKNREGGGSLVTERFNRFGIADEKEEIYGVLFSRGGGRS